MITISSSNAKWVGVQTAQIGTQPRSGRPLRVNLAVHLSKTTGSLHVHIYHCRHLGSAVRFSARPTRLPTPPSPLMSVGRRRRQRAAAAERRALTSGDESDAARQSAPTSGGDASGQRSSLISGPPPPPQRSSAGNQLRRQLSGADCHAGGSWTRVYKSVATVWREV